MIHPLQLANMSTLNMCTKSHVSSSLQPTCTNVCFYYVPERLRDVKFDLSDAEFSQEINAIPPVIKGKMTERGSMMTGYQPIDDKPNFFRMIVISEDVTFQDMEFVIEEIDSIGRKL